MIRLFCGYDARESIGFHTFVHSVIKRASVQVSFIPVSGLGGSNAFTLSRFLVPYLSGFTGRAIFMDASDMLMLADVKELADCFDPACAVQVVKHPDYQSQHERKYIGTQMECDQTNYRRKNWTSVMLMNCDHPAWIGMVPEVIKSATPIHWLTLSNLKDREIGELDPAWNVLIDEGQDDTNAKVLHWTAGVPTFKHYQNARRSKDWFCEMEEMAR